jgi:hypothetical protein
VLAWDLVRRGIRRDAVRLGPCLELATPSVARRRVGQCV